MAQEGNDHCAHKRELNRPKRRTFDVPSLMLVAPTCLLHNSDPKTCQFILSPKSRPGSQNVSIYSFPKVMTCPMKIQSCVSNFIHHQKIRRVPWKFESWMSGLHPSLPFTSYSPHLKFGLTARSFRAEINATRTTNRGFVNASQLHQARTPPLRQTTLSPLRQALVTHTV